ncbi:type IV pilus biogenesis protein PilJ [hydrothermal vent metagenome]|uniref:Type IV pilus biogenesis protein PilJ n=1 Tax=hydrothermal vent metagenome TaxID=652676 RepID=A0A3B0X7C5_9ZZZZ
MKQHKQSSILRGFRSSGNIKITHKLTGIIIALLLGFLIIGFAYQQVLQSENEALKTSKKMLQFENGIHEVQLDLLNAQRSEVEFYLKKYPIYLGKFDTRIIVASQNLKSLTNLVSEEQELSIVTELGEAFETYRDKFIKAAESQVEIGLDKNTGLLLELAETGEEISNMLKKAGSPVLDRSFLKIQQNLNEFLRLENEKFRDLVVIEINTFKEVLKSSELSSDRKLNLFKLMSAFNKIFITTSDTITLLVKQKKSVRTAAKNIGPLFDKMISISNQIISNSREIATQKRNNITIFFIATLILIALVISTGLLLLARSIIKPMKTLQNTVLKVNGGDLNARSNLNRGDELGELSDAFDKLLDERLTSMALTEKESEKLNDSVIDLIKAVSTLAQQKDLAMKIPVSEDITGAISDSLNLLSKETAKIMRQVQTTASQVANVSATVKKQSDAVISVAQSERKEVISTAQLLEKSVNAVNVISRDAKDANKKAENTIKNTQKAMDTVLSSAEGINSIRSTISETEKRIKRLGERSQEISGIVNLINSIAERTHILALNASMHAASAGEAGRGFAVVAEEVQRLAENAREATSEITTVVGNIRNETSDTVNIMNTVISQVAQGTQLTNQACESMKLTQQTIGDLVKSVQTIAKSSEQQVSISKQLLERARVIKESTERTGRELLEQNKSTDKLVRYSENLVTIVGVFKLPEEDNFASQTQSFSKRAV